MQFVRAAVDFLYEEVMLQSKARGIALHVVDVLTDEFQVLLGAVADSASNNGPSSVAHTPEQEQEVGKSIFFLGLLSTA